MKAVQINFSEDLLARLDADEVVRQMGRSEVVRRIAEAYLRRRESQRIDEALVRGYGPEFPPIEEELGDWLTIPPTWPDD